MQPSKRLNNMFSQSIEYLRQNPFIGAASGLVTPIIIQVQSLVMIGGLISILSNLAVVFGCVASFATMIIQVSTMLRRGIKRNGTKDNTGGGTD